jgi:hypothetical protein
MRTFFDPRSRLGRFFRRESFGTNRWSLVVDNRRAIGDNLSVEYWTRLRFSPQYHQ